MAVLPPMPSAREPIAMAVKERFLRRSRRPKRRSARDRSRRLSTVMLAALLFDDRSAGVLGRRDSRAARLRPWRVALLTTHVLFVEAGLLVYQRDLFAFDKQVFHLGLDF